jgi:hypothetical protein
VLNEVESEIGTVSFAGYAFEDVDPVERFSESLKGLSGLDSRYIASIPS